MSTKEKGFVILFNDGVWSYAPSRPELKALVKSEIEAITQDPVYSWSDARVLEMTTERLTSAKVACLDHLEEFTGDLILEMRPLTDYISFSMKISSDKIAFEVKLRRKTKGK